MLRQAFSEQAAMAPNHCPGSRAKETSQASLRGSILDLMEDKFLNL
jgi:hypothetical protein